MHILQRAKADANALRALTNIDGIGGVRAAPSGELDERGDLVASGGGFEHGDAPRPSIE
jgi:hypothetical protein